MLVLSVLSCLSGAGAAGDQQQTLACILLCRSNVNVCLFFCASLSFVHYISFIFRESLFCFTSAMIKKPLHYVFEGAQIRGRSWRCLPPQVEVLPHPLLSTWPLHPWRKFWQLDDFGCSLNIPVPLEHHIFSFSFHLDAYIYSYYSTSTPMTQGRVWAQKAKIRQSCRGHVVCCGFPEEKNGLLTTHWVFTLLWKLSRKPARRRSWKGR